MNALSHIIVLVAAFLAVYLECTFDLFRNILGAQVDLLPALIVYASLTHSILFVAVLAFCGGLFFDSMSANAFGVSVTPLFFCGLIIYRYRTLLLREKPYAQFVLGTAASATAPLLSLLTLLTLDRNPMFGGGTIWQIVVMAVFGGCITPLLFRFFDRANRTFNYAILPDSSFRSDREIKRGRG
jgi:hypothetical protein